MRAPRLPHRSRLLPLVLAAAAGSALARPARADEIVVRDPETCEVKTIRAAEIPAETQTEIQYRERERGPVKTVPTASVVEIRRTSADPQASKLLEAIEEVEKGNAREAREALSKVSGGGWTVSLEGKKTYTPFNAGDPAGRGKRPSWVSEYAHFFLAKAIVLQGLEEKKTDVLEEALLALDDVPVPGGDGKAKTGGFLARFREGNSRWYPEALLLKARALVGLARYDEAAKIYDELYSASVSTGIGARWAYEAKLGPGEIAAAQGKPVDAVTAYKAAAEVLRILLEKETRTCVRREIGRLYSRARVRAAAVMLAAAEEHKSKSEFQELRQYIEEGSPESLRKKFAGRPKPELDAIVGGARDPYVQAVSGTGLGMAFFSEGRHEEAILVLRGVAVKYFQVPDEPARALWYLAQAADAAAKQARGEAARLYGTIKDDALKTLQAAYPNSPFARK